MLKIASTLVYSNFLLALGATIQILGISKLTESYANPIPYGIGLFFLTIAGYSLYQLNGLDNNNELHERVQWRKANKKVLQVLVLFGIAGSWPLLKNSFFAFPYLWILCFLLSISYTSFISFFPRIKQIPFAKTIVIGVVWSMVLTILPLLTWDNAHYPLYKLALLFICKANWFIAITIPFELRDVKMDKAYNTFGILGWKRGKALAQLLSLCSMLILVSIHPEKALSIIIPALFTAIMIYQCNEKRGDLYYGVCLDGLLIVQGFCWLF